MKKYFTTVILSATLLFSVQPSAQAVTFTDVPTAHWAHEAITSISKRGLINGYPDGTYRLNEPVTRAQAAKIVALAINAKPSATFTPQFQDVSPAHGSYNHIRALTERGIFTDGDKFHPNVPLTRAQMAKMLIIGYDITMDDNDLIHFEDVRKINQNYRYITTLAEIGITTTPPGGNFNPNDNVSRAHMAAFVDRTTTFDQNRKKGLIVYDQNQRQYIEKKASEPLAPVVDNRTKTAQLVNEERKKHGAKELAFDNELSTIAQKKAEDMANNNYFAHESPTYGSVDNMLDIFKYSWKGYGENIAKGYTSSEAVVDGWLSSQGHRANIVNNQFTNIGSGYATDNNGTTYWVHLFSSKK